MMSQTQLAKELGVSQQAVSFALNGTGTLAEATRKRILEGAERLGYRKNPVPQMMLSGKTKSVGLLMRESSVRIPDTLVRGALQWLEEHHHTLSYVFVTDAQLRGEAKPPLAFRERRIDGCLVFLPRSSETDILPLLRDNQIPSVWINEDFETNAVYPDDEFLGYRATQLLLEQQVTRVAYMGPEREGGHYSERDRRRGAERAMQEAGIEVCCSDKASNSGEPALEGAVAFLQNPNRPDGVVCYGKGEADNLMLAARELGIKVPDAFKILVIEHAGAMIGSIFYTTLRIPLYHIGVKAIEVLAEIMMHPDEPASSVAVQHEQLDRGMTVCNALNS